jgi:hypothetical protein
MSDQPRRGGSGTDAHGEGASDRGTPRWRGADASQADVEHDHRLHDDPAPTERGAIDREDSVGRRTGKGKRRPPR